MGHLVSVVAAVGMALLPATAYGSQYSGSARVVPPLIVLVQGQLGSQPKRETAGERKSRAPSEQLVALTGQWRWAATCERGKFSGVMHLVQAGNEFTGKFGETNFWDKGTISNGQIRGSRITFDRWYSFIHQHLEVNLLSSSGNLSMKGPYSSVTFGKCELIATKNND
jgi:hypothetical protein